MLLTLQILTANTIYSNNSKHDAAGGESKVSKWITGFVHQIKEEKKAFSL